MAVLLEWKLQGAVVFRETLGTLGPIDSHKKKGAIASTV